MPVNTEVPESTRLHPGIDGSESGLTPLATAATCLILLALLLLTIGLARLPLGRWNLIFAMIISTIKMALIALYFMHLRHGGKTIWVFAAAGFFWLLIMAGLSLSDYLTRMGPY